MIESGYISRTSDVISFLQENGYPVARNSNYISFPAYWRNGNNPTSVTGYPEQNLFIDWVSSEKFDFKGLVKRVLDIKDDKDLANKIDLNNFNSKNQVSLKQEIKIQEIFPEEIIKELEPNNEYWYGRGISEDTIKQFEGGISLHGRFKNRQCLIIKNSKGQIIGVTGRDLTNKKIAKWKHVGAKGNWVWPASINSHEIQNKQSVILVESPADIISLFECGIKNVLCLFGVELHLGILNFLLKLNLNKIIIATNNEINFNGGVGNNAALKIKAKLDKYFDSHTSIIKLPPGKDFNEILVKNGKPLILEWSKI